MTTYTPSGKHPNILVIAFNSIVGAVVGGIVGFVSIFITRWMLFTIIKEQVTVIIRYPAIVIIVAFLLICIPVLMGYLSGIISALRSRNHKISNYFSIVASIGSIIIMIILLITALEINFRDWLVLDWIIIAEKSEMKWYEYFLHIIPIIITIITGVGSAMGKVSQPFCEACKRYNTKKILGNIVGRIKESDLEKSVSEIPFNKLAPLEELKKEYGDKTSWSALTFHSCKSCDAPGYLTIKSHWFEKKGSGELKEKNRDVITYMALNQEQTRGAKKFISK